MPKRTNEFQQLIYSIQHQLASGAVVTESKILIDVKTNEPTEVDIVVESTIGEIPLVIGIECTAERRPATVEWVREMIGKHANLKIHKTVLVAKSGFTPKAIKTAQVNGVEAISLVEAENTKWVTLIEQLRDLKLARFTFRAVAQNITFKVMNRFTPPTVGPLSLIHEPGRETSYSLKDFLIGIARYGPLAQEVMRRWVKTSKDERKKEYEINVTWKCPEGTVLQSDDGTRQPILDIEIKLGINVDNTPLELKSGQFVTTQVAYGTAHNILDESKSPRRKVLVTLFSKEGKLGAGTLLIPAFGKEDGRIYSLKLPEEDTEEGKTNDPNA
jgi:hypothetical protein